MGKSPGIQKMKKYQFEFMLGLAFVFIMFFFGGLMMWVAHDAQIRWGDAMKNKTYQYYLWILCKISSYLFFK